jgi:hypothetical protein
MTADDQGARPAPPPDQGRLPDKSLSRVVLIGVGAYRSGQLENVRPELFLALPGTDPGLPAYTALPFSAIRETFGRSRAQVKILILDCCYSGLAIGRPLSGPGPGDPDEFAIKGAAILVSSGPYELSWVRDGHPLTAFTGALVSVFRDGIPGAGPLLSLRAVADQTKRRLIAENLPVPRRLEVGDAGSLALVRNHAAITVNSSPRQPHRPAPARESGRQQLTCPTARARGPTPARR